MTFRFEELNVYQKAINFVDLVYKTTNRFPKDELFTLTSQLRRAAISIVLNIAEGSGRTKQEFNHFLNIARTSAYECVACLTLAARMGYITNSDYQTFYMQIVEICKMLNGLKNSL